MKRNITKAITLLLLALMVLASCNGEWSFADAPVDEATAVQQNLYTVSYYYGDTKLAYQKVLTTSEPEDATSIVTAITGYDILWFTSDGTEYTSWGETLTDNLDLYAYGVLTSANFGDSFKAGGYYALSGDVTVDADTFKAATTGGYLTISNDLTVNLNTYALTIEEIFSLSDSSNRYRTIIQCTKDTDGNVTLVPEVVISNGTLNVNNTASDPHPEGALLSLDNASLCVSGVNYNVNNGTGMLVKSASSVTLDNTYMKVSFGWSGISTTNGDLETQSGTAAYLYINIKNGSTVEVLGDESWGYTSYPVSINRDKLENNSENTVLTISDSTIIGNYHAVSVRGGKATISNSTLKTMGQYDFTKGDAADNNLTGQDVSYRDTSWRDDPWTIYATLVVGCNANGSNSSEYIPYTANSNVTLENVTFESKARWIIGVGGATGGEESTSGNAISPSITITIDSATNDTVSSKSGEDLITVTRKDSSNSIKVNDTEWTYVYSSSDTTNSKGNTEPYTTST